MKHLYIFLLLLLVACSQVTDRNGDQVARSPAASDPPAPSQTPANTLTPSELPVTIPVPSETPIPATQEASLQVFALNNVATQDRGGVTVEIVRILIGESEILDSQLVSETLELSEALLDKPVVGWLVFSISNNSGYGIHLHPRRGTVLINGEQIELKDYESYTSVSDNFDGAYFPGEQVIGGGVWFGIESSEVDEITEMTIMMHGPHFIEKDEYGESYYFVLDLSDHVFEELPEDLK